MKFQKKYKPPIANVRHCSLLLFLANMVKNNYLCPLLRCQSPFLSGLASKKKCFLCSQADPEGRFTTFVKALQATRIDKEITDYNSE
jgi:hypothetical protein